MPLSQVLKDEMALVVEAEYTDIMEDVVYSHRTSANGTPAVSTVRMLLVGYRQRDIDMDLILPNDLKGRVATSRMRFAPTRHDSFVRSDGTGWKVEQVSGGAMQPFWFMQSRQVA